MSRSCRCHRRAPEIGSEILLGGTPSARRVVIVVELTLHVVRIVCEGTKSMIIWSYDHTRLMAVCVLALVATLVHERMNIGRTRAYDHTIRDETARSEARGQTIEYPEEGNPCSGTIEFLENTSTNYITESHMVAERG